MRNFVSEIGGSYDDVLVWPDDTWCYYHEYLVCDNTWRGDDYYVLDDGTVEHALWIERSES